MERARDIGDGDGPLWMDSVEANAAAPGAGVRWRADVLPIAGQFRTTTIGNDDYVASSDSVRVSSRVDELL
jgi:hypothetical protein